MTAALIVLIDDDCDSLEICRMILDQAGFRVLCCPEIEEAFEKMAKEPPALVITDLMMDSLDAGFRVCSRIKTDPQLANVPVVILTAVGKQLGMNFQPQGREDLQAMRADAFLEKPIRAPMLLKTVKGLLAGGESSNQK